MSQPPQIFIIEDDPAMQLCLQQIIGQPCACFANAIDAINALEDNLPQLIFLDVLLDGPDAFTFLNELASYSDLAQIPVVLMSNLQLKHRDFSTYGVVAVLDKATMQPEDIKKLVQEYCHAH